MIKIEFTHPATGELTQQQIDTFCPSCVRDFQPLDDEQQAEVGAPIELHCPVCGVLALRWYPPVPAPPPPDPITEEEDAAG